MGKSTAQLKPNLYYLNFAPKLTEAPIGSTEIRSLTLEQQLHILKRLFTEVLLAEPEERDLTVTDLRGLGKEIWQGLDAQEYVDHERDSWQ